MYYETTSDLAKNCGLAAVKSRIKAYVRLTHPFYHTHLEGEVNGEGDPVVPDGSRGYWWHESLRALASIPEWVLRCFLDVQILTSIFLKLSIYSTRLPLVVLRIGATYGPQQIWGTGQSRLPIRLLPPGGAQPRSSESFRTVTSYHMWYSVLANHHRPRIPIQGGGNEIYVRLPLLDFLSRRSLLSPM